eukprot:TRINITY_DN37894_c0_g1_i1.p1 TRINITY_DN37894_c0_g1~~TRINITY_DN37894_c0_g1_i1.p1  ORF type:complete len:379 (+),score=36.06 TRINITY_DN37894_c0_g1_i1:89-1225(+)
MPEASDDSDHLRQSISMPQQSFETSHECLQDWQSSWPRSIVYAAVISKHCGFLYNCRMPVLGTTTFITVMAMEVGCFSLMVTSAWLTYARNKEEDPSSPGLSRNVVSALTGASFFVASGLVQLVMHRWGFADMIDDLRALTVPSITTTNAVFIVVVILNQIAIILAVWRPDSLIADFGPLFESIWIRGLWFISCSTITPGFTASLSLLMGIASGLRRELRTVEVRLGAGDLAGAEHAYGRFLKFVFITRPIYQACAWPLVGYAIICTSVATTKLVDNMIDGKHSTMQQYFWGAIAVFLLFFVTAPLGDLPTRHSCVRVAVSEYSQSCCRKDVVTLLATMNAMQDQSGMKIFGTLITRSYLIKVVSYISVVMSVLKRIA